MLLETTDLALADVAFAAGFASVRQFNDTIREVYASTPTELRGRRGRRDRDGHACSCGWPCATPFAGRALLAFLAARAVPGVEARRRRRTPARCACRTAPAPSGSSSTDHRRAGQTAFVPATFALADLRDLAAAVERARRLLDADCDPVAIDDALAGDPLLGPLVAAHARAAGARATSTATSSPCAPCSASRSRWPRARTVAGRLTAEHGEPLAEPATAS